MKHLQTSINLLIDLDYLDKVSSDKDLKNIKEPKELLKMLFEKGVLIQKVKGNSPIICMRNTISDRIIRFYKSF